MGALASIAQNGENERSPHASSGRCTAPAPMTVLDGPPSSTVAWESTPKAPVRMFIADDQPLAVIGIRSICATAKPLVEVVATTDSTSGLLDAPNLSACDEIGRAHV